MWEWGCPLESLTNLRNTFLINIKRNYKIPEEESRFRSSKLLISLNPAFSPNFDSHLPSQEPGWIFVSLETEQCWFVSWVANRDLFLPLKIARSSLSLWGQIWGRDLSHQFGIIELKTLSSETRIKQWPCYFLVVRPSARHFYSQTFSLFFC